MGPQGETDALSAEAKRFLDLLTLPPPVLDKGTPYERDETPFCRQGNESLVVVFEVDARNSTWMGDEDNFSKTKWYELPNRLITDLLAEIHPGGPRTCAVGLVKVFKEEHAFGYDCEEPYDLISHRKVHTTLFAELSADQRTATLMIARLQGDKLETLVCLSRTAKA